MQRADAAHVIAGSFDAAGYDYASGAKSRTLRGARARVPQIGDFPEQSSIYTPSRKLKILR